MSQPPAVLAIALATVLAAIGALHVYWALGGRSGGAAIPSRTDGAALFAPSAASTLAVAAALALAAWIVVVAGGLVSPVGPWWPYAIGVRVLALVLAARAIGDFRYVGVFKRVRGTPFAVRDDRVYTPLCAALALGVLWVALGSRARG
jgi:hypothetical protein